MPLPLIEQYKEAIRVSAAIAPLIAELCRERNQSPHVLFVRVRQVLVNDVFFPESRS